MSKLPKPLDELLTERIQHRTGRRVRGLTVAFEGESVVLRGSAGSFHVKQLAIHGVRDVLTRAPIRNSIVVGA